MLRSTFIISDNAIRRSKYRKRKKNEFTNKKNIRNMENKKKMLQKTLFTGLM